MKRYHIIYERTRSRALVWLCCIVGAVASCKHVVRHAYASDICASNLCSLADVLQAFDTTIATMAKSKGKAAAVVLTPAQTAALKSQRELTKAAMKVGIIVDEKPDQFPKLAPSTGASLTAGSAIAEGA